MKDDAERARATLISAMEHDKRSQRRIAAGYNTSITSDEAIKAIMLAQQPEGWRLIETAPKDGSTVDLWQGGERWPDCYWEGGMWWGGCLQNPTHWQPLPAPPAAMLDVAPPGEE